MGRHDVLPQLRVPRLSIPKPPHGGNGLGIVEEEVEVGLGETLVRTMWREAGDECWENLDEFAKDRTCGSVVCLFRLLP